MANGHANEDELEKGKLFKVELVKSFKTESGKVSLQRPEAKETADQALWVAIRNRAQAIDFDRYKDFIDKVLCEGSSPEHGGTCKGESDETKMGSPSIEQRRNDLLSRPTIHGVDAYNLLKLATEIFLTLNAGAVKEDGSLLDPNLFNNEKEENRLHYSVSPEDIQQKLASFLNTPPHLPYLKQVVDSLDLAEEDLPYCTGLLQHRFSCPSLIELIWSYWHEEGMLAQTMNAIAIRFQNRRNGLRDPLAQLEIDPLRPLNNLLWGYIQDDHNRLSVARRAYEYDHHYGLTLVGKAVPDRLDSADSRSKFIETFHNLLYRASVFFREDSDTTIISDGFPLLNALKEAHLVLAEGAHNQFGDLPWTARAEMLMQQWLLARPEMRDFLRGRIMVPYEEKWMGAVDTMKRFQGWTDTGISHFHELAVTGEQVLLSVRYGNWNDLNNTEENAKNWARYWKTEIQRYIHGYQAVTGIDLAMDVTGTVGDSKRYLKPSEHLQRRLAAQHAQGSLSSPRAVRKEIT